MTVDELLLNSLVLLGKELKSGAYLVVKTGSNVAAKYKVDTKVFTMYTSPAYMDDEFSYAFIKQGDILALDTSDDLEFVVLDTGTPTPDPTPVPDPVPVPVPAPIIAGAMFTATGTYIYDDVSSRVISPSNTSWKSKIAGYSLHPEYGFDGSDGNLTYGIPYNVVTNDQPMVPIYIDNSEGWEIQHSDFYPSDRGLLPVPLNAKRENDPVISEDIYEHDRHLLTLVVDSAGKPLRLIELWHAVKELSNGKHVGWRCQNCSIFDCTKGLPQRPIMKTSADAAGLPIAPLLFTPKDILEAVNKANPDDRHLGHALRYTLPTNIIRRAFTFPACHYTPQNIPDSSMIPFGARLRLQSSVDLYSTLPAWGKTDVADGNLNLAYANVIALTLKKYGMILADNGGPLYLTGAPWKPSEFDISQSVYRGLEGINGSHFDFIDTGTVYHSGNLVSAGSSTGLPVWDL